MYPSSEVFCLTSLPVDNRRFHTAGLRWSKIFKPEVEPSYFLLLAWEEGKISGCLCRQDFTSMTLKSDHLLLQFSQKKMAVAFCFLSLARNGRARLFSMGELLYRVRGQRERRDDAIAKFAQGFIPGRAGERAFARQPIHSSAISRLRANDDAIISGMRGWLESCASGNRYRCTRHTYT